jgi:hypothetical protein
VNLTGPGAAVIIAAPCIVLASVALLGATGPHDVTERLTAPTAEEVKPTEPVHHAPLVHHAARKPVAVRHTVPTATPVPVKPRATDTRPRATDIMCWNEARRPVSRPSTFGFHWRVTYSDGTVRVVYRRITEVQFNSYSTVPGNYPCTFQGA